MNQSDTTNCVYHMQEAINTLKAAKVHMQELNADYQEALKLLARTEEERRIAVAQVAHFKELVDQKNKELEEQYQRHLNEL